MLSLTFHAAYLFLRCRRRVYRCIYTGVIAVQSAVKDGKHLAAPAALRVQNDAFVLGKQIHLAENGLSNTATGAQGKIRYAAADKHSGRKTGIGGFSGTYGLIL